MNRRLPVLIVLMFSARAMRAQNTPTRCSLDSDRLRIDSIPGIGMVSFAGGTVKMRCPARGITITGDSAERFADHSQIIGHAVYDEPRFHVTANYLNYFPTDDKVVAVGDVHAKLPSGSTLDGPQAEYRRAIPKVKGRERAQMSAIARPTITILEKDSAGKQQPPSTVVADNVFVDGDSASLIYGWGRVVINRIDIGATADSAFIDEPHEIMRLMKTPVVTGKKDRPFRLSGNLIEMFSRNRRVYRVLSRANATAASDSMTLKSDTIDLRVRNDLLDRAYAWGPTGATVVSPSQNLKADSLDVVMPGQRITVVNALRHAYASGRPDTTRFHVTKPDTSDWMRGDTIFAHFDTTHAPRDTSKNPTIKQLIASGHASSYYHLAPSDSGERRPAIQYVNARIITVNFNQQKVATATTVDSVSGVYVEPVAVADSTTRRGRGTAPAPPNRTPTRPGTAPKSVVPVPTKPPETKRP
jgi:hypothetical protein